MTEPKPRCREMLQQIEAYLDGELDTAVHVRIEDHISDCPPCYERTEFKRHLRVMTSSKCTGDRVPPELVEKIRDMITGHAPPS